MCGIYTSVKVQPFFYLKSSIPLSLPSCVVYKFDCAGNPEVSFIGQTYRHLQERVLEQLTSDR